MLQVDRLYEAVAQHSRVGRRHRAAGDRPAALGGVLPIPLGVPDVVNNVHQ